MRKLRQWRCAAVHAATESGAALKSGRLLTFGASAHAVQPAGPLQGCAVLRAIAPPLERAPGPRAIRPMLCPVRCPFRLCRCSPPRLTQTLDALLCAQISASNKTVFFLKSNLKFLRGTPWRNILKNWLFLATAIISEVIATSALKSSEGFTRLVPSFIVVAGYAAAFYFLSLTLKSIPVGIAYAVWSGLGIVLVTAIAWVLHGQKLDMWGFVGVGFIISGVAVLNLLSKASVH